MQANEDFDVVDVTAVITAGMNLLSICESGNFAECKRLIEEEDAPVWFQEPETGWSPLHIAAHLESREMIEYLLAHGAVWNAGKPPLDCLDTYPLELMRLSHAPCS
ncbi:Arginine N-methyltransferase 2 [Tulasnella sp. 418]|nr:Arginine N-methyltransferase 2 [Tulasnella sp. 418]